MTTNPPAAVDRIPTTRSVSYAVRGAPELPAHGASIPGTTLAPNQVTFTYHAAPDSQLGRITAGVRGFWMRDGERVNPGQPMAQHYFGDTADWPEWLAEEARLHDPDAAVPSAPVDRAAVLAEAADAPAAECSAQNRNYESGPRLCIRAAQHHGDHIDERGFHWSDTVAVYPVDDGTFRRGTDVRAALRRMAAEEQQPETQAQPPTTCWHLEILDGIWASYGPIHSDRTEAVARYRSDSEQRPTWNDVTRTPVQRRIVREATTYTVEPAAAAQPETVHACPPDGSGLTPCCGRTPFELPRTDRMTTDPAEATCTPVV